MMKEKLPVVSSQWSVVSCQLFVLLKLSCHKQRTVDNGQFFIHRSAFIVSSNGCEKSV
jgi:hypothetical protein